MKTAYNPYDFANPVGIVEMFAGRKDEREEVAYYLNHARNARPIHLAITGERASGKTSMLNVVSREAKDLGFLVTRIDLNESDAEAINFFPRLYDELLSQLTLDGKYGGREGQVWKSYRTIMDSGRDADLPLGFPSHVVAARSGTGILSTAILQSDLEQISNVAGKPIIILIDECNVLTKSRITLEIIRNLFMNMSNFMLVIAGTPGLFPVIDDIYSPIARQFKKIELNAFEDEEETEECIRLPLHKVEIDPIDAFDSWPYVIADIHRMTGGRPYEVQLLCHVMYKRMEQGIEEQLVVNVEALDTVRQELEQRQGHDLGRLANIYHKLSDSAIHTIAMLRRVVDGQPKMALDVSIISPESDLFTNIPEATFLAHITHLEAKGILVPSGSGFKLGGDQFDEVYLRYLALSRDIFIPTSGRNLDLIMHESIMDTLDSEENSRFTEGWLGLKPERFQKRVEKLLSGRTDSPPRSSEADQRSWFQLYRPLWEAQAQESSELCFLRISVQLTDDASVGHYGMSRTTADTLQDGKAFKEFIKRVESCGGNVQTELISFDISGVDPVSSLVPTDDLLSEKLSERFEHLAGLHYRNDEFAASAKLFHLAFEIKATSLRAVSAAFQFLHLQMWEEAIIWTYKADWAYLKESGDRDEDQLHLGAFDRALAYIMLGEYDKAETELITILSTCQEHAPAYLLTARQRINGDWELAEAGDSIVEEAQLLLTDLVSSRQPK